MINIPVKKIALSSELNEKRNKLISVMTDYMNEGALITFSGGVDSTFLVWAAQKVLSEYPERKVIALTTNSASMPEQDRDDAQKITKKLGIPHIWRESREMDNPAYTTNDEMRCYHCKSELFTIAKEEAEKNALKWIIYGYNASDISDIRPGHQAARENGVLHPLADLGFTKEDIRAILKNESIEIAEKPASPCLSSRIAHGISVSSGKLADIAAMENLLRRQGVNVCRVRINETGTDLFLRIEIHPDEIQKVLSIKDLLNNEGRQRGYKWVTLDLSGYRTGGGTE
jgi:pyridinium-3,5-biscarboxylic acid mononucleotide sulfurtransferase